MARPSAKELTGRELEVMKVFWKHGELTAQEAPTPWPAAGSTGRTQPWPR